MFVGGHETGQPNMENLNQPQIVKLDAKAADAIVIIKACPAPGIFALIPSLNCGIL
jgi:hypothetical protein